VGELDLQTGHLGAGGALTGSEPSWQAGQNGIYGMMERSGRSWQPYGDDGGASRFYPVFRYEPKASRRERPVVDGVAHPTVKPLGLMRWLVRLVTPPGGLVLDMFAGSGTTLEAAAAEGFRVVGVEREAAYLPLIRARLNRATPTPRAVRPRRAGREPQPTLW
jgi:site-specific DNA-methyltransferase (adenine-specific)